ncbi:MAG: hypothetical protein ABF730_09980 [Bifidobacterium aquikefiri]
MAGITMMLVMPAAACSSVRQATPIEPTGSSSSTSRDTTHGEAPSPAANMSSTTTASPSPTGAQENLGTYRQLFADPTLAQCMAEIMGQHVDDQLTRQAAEGMTGIGGLGVANDSGLPDTEHPHCGIALKNVTSLSGLEHFTNIQTLYLDGLTHVSDLTPIRGLDRLMMLRLNGTAVTDYSQLNMPKRIFNLDVYVNPGQPTPTIAQQRAWRINIITQ